MVLGRKKRTASQKAQRKAIKKAKRARTKRGIMNMIEGRRVSEDFKI